MDKQNEFEKLKDDVHYLIVAHCKYKDMSMYDRAMKQFQEDIGYDQFEEMSYDERFAFLLGFEASLKEIENAITDTKEEMKDKWEMKCPYEEEDEYWALDSHGNILLLNWDSYDFEKNRLNQGNTFKTKEAAELESKRRNLLTRFRAFRDECNGDWKPDWSNRDKKWEIDYSKEEGLKALWTIVVNAFPTFGYFKNEEDIKRAIELFGDEIKELFVDGE